MRNQHSTSSNSKSSSKATRRQPAYIPNLVTIHDLTEEERQHVEIYRVGHTPKWRWKDDGYKPRKVGYARPLR